MGSCLKTVFTENITYKSLLDFLGEVLQSVPLKTFMSFRLTLLFVNFFGEELLLLYVSAWKYDDFSPGLIRLCACDKFYEVWRLLRVGCLFVGGDGEIDGSLISEGERTLGSK